MRLVLFRTRGAPSTAPLRVGALHPDGQHVADISSAYADAGVPALSSMRTFLELGAPAREVANRALSSSAYWRALEHVDLRAPIYDPCVCRSVRDARSARPRWRAASSLPQPIFPAYSEKVLCVGMNYADHCYEQNLPLPVEPVIFRSVGRAAPVRPPLRARACPLTLLRFPPPCPLRASILQQVSH
jgi:hypothetical protein